MMRGVPRRIRRASRPDVGTDDHPAFDLTKAASNQKSDKPIGISIGAIRNADGVFPEDPFQTGLTLEELEAILPQEYGPLTPWVEKKLRFEYGVRDLPDPDFPSQRLQIVAPIAEELVHDTIVDLWIKTKEKKVEVKDKTHVRRWLKGALRISLRRWAQSEARDRYRFVYPSAEEDLYESRWLELIDKREQGRARREVEELYLQLHQAIDDSRTPASQDRIPSDELTTAMTHLPSGIRKVVHQVYVENVPWQDVSASHNVECETLKREVQQWLHSRRPYIPSYQPSQRSKREATRRVRKSFHCPLCETTVKRKKGRYGAVCNGCGIGIHKDQIAIQYSYRHA